MKAVLLCLCICLLLPFYSFEQTAKKLGYVPAVATIDTTLTVKEKTIQCQILKITNATRQSKIMIVLIASGTFENESRTTMRINYMFKRERIYLKSVFVANVAVLETHRTIVDLNSLLEKLKEKYEGIQVWTMIDADAFFSKTPQHLENLYSSHR
jgi:hypothetical protein